MDTYHIHQRMGGMCPLQASESKLKLRHNKLGKDQSLHSYEMVLKGKEDEFQKTG